MQPLENRLLSQERADRSAWKRRARSQENWQLVLTLANCTAGEIWQEMQKQTFLQPPADEDLRTEWEYVVTRAGEKPPESEVRQRQQSQTYMDRMMRAQRR